MKTIKKISIFLFCLFAISMGSPRIFAQASVEFSVTVAPPPLPVYDQPPCPFDGYIWTPGYWAYNGDDYYWVPGVWVMPPHFGYFWTPCYWGFSNGYYGFHRGYWGAHIGYYGGVNYGYGYVGTGFCGGRWEGEHFVYNTAVVNVNRTVVHNTYIDRTVVVNNNRPSNRASFNGPGGVTTRPTRQEEAIMRENHVAPTKEQLSHQQVASRDRSQFASENKGRPTAAAMNKVGGQAFNPQGHPTAYRTSVRNQQNNNQGSLQSRSANSANKNQNVQRPQQSRAASSTNNNQNAKREQQHNSNVVNGTRRLQQNNNAQSQHSQPMTHQQNANASNNSREQQQKSQQHVQQNAQSQQHAMQSQQHNNPQPQRAQKGGNQPHNNNSNNHQAQGQHKPQEEKRT